MIKKKWRLPARIRAKFYNSFLITFLFVCIIQGISILISGFDIVDVLNGFILFFIIGFTISVCEVFIFQNFFRRRSFLIKTLVQSVFYVALIGVFTFAKAIYSSRIYVQEQNVIAEQPDMLDNLSYSRMQLFAQDPLG